VLLLIALFVPGVATVATQASLPIRPLSLVRTGFGVPGSGRPCIFGHYVLLNSGEGDLTLCDVSDKQSPSVVRYIPSYLFTYFLYPLPSRDLVYLNSHGGPLLVIRGLRNLEAAAEIKQTPWNREKWGPAFLAGLRPDGIGYSIVPDFLVVLDLNDPDHPRELARLSEPGLKPRAKHDESQGVVFSPDFRLAAVELEGGKRVRLLRWKSGTKAETAGEFENTVATLWMSPWYGRVLALDDDRLVISDPTSHDQFWRSRGLSFWEIKDPAKARRVSQITFDTPVTNIRDIILAGTHAYVTDGREIVSGHTVQRGQRSRLFVLDLTRLDQPRIATNYQEKLPSEFNLMQLDGSTLYVNDYNYGVRIFDVHDPEKPVQLGGAPAAAEGHWLYLRGTYAYVGHTFGGTIHVVDVADTSRPRTVGYYFDGQWLNTQAKIRGSGIAMYLPQFSGLAIVDISAPTHPKRAGEFLDEAGKPLEWPCVAVDGKHAYVTTGLPAPKTGAGAARLLIYDVSQPLAPKLVSTTPLPGNRGARIAGAGTMLYLSSYGGKRFMAVDAVDPLHPRVTADLDAPTAQIGGRTVSLAIADGGGGGAPGIAVARGWLYVATVSNKRDQAHVLIFDVRDPQAIRLAGALYVTDREGWQFFASDLAVEGNRLFLEEYGREQVYDLSNPASPSLLGQYSRGYAWQIGQARGNLLYVPKLDGLEILEIG
jgi:hypothetical protein